MKRAIALAALTFALVVPALASADDAATLVFASGQVVRINDGYKAVVAAMSSLNSETRPHKIVELNIEGGSFMLDVASVVVVCRGRCSSLEIVDVRDPARTPTR